MGSTDWRTPPAFFADLHREFDFTVDVAASCENALLPRFYTKDDDGLEHDWSNERAYCNPPYSPATVLYRFVEKAALSAKSGALVVMLLNATTTDTRWFHRFIWDAKLHRPRGRVEVRFLQGRIAFHGVQNTPIESPRYSNMVVIFHPREAAL